jgi:DNA topoisomerase-1
VKATVGHLRDLPTRELGVDVDNGFEPKYVTIKGKTKTLSELKKAAKAASAIYLATDPDREGEAIAWHVADQIKAGVPTHRILFHEITKEAIQEALRAPGEIDNRLAASSTGWWDTRPAPSFGRASRPGSRPAGFRRWRCA